MTDFTGELAALGTALSFAFGSTLFTFAGRHFGSALVNRTRLLMSVVILMAIHLFLYHELLPSQITPESFFWLAASGIVGLALGDASLFQAFILIGPRLSMLMMALAPVVSVILAWLFLGEVLSFQSLLGIGLTVAGIFWVVSERQGRKKQKTTSDLPTRTYLLGLLFGLGGALGQASGLILSKFALNEGVEPLSATLIRMLVAMFWVWTIAVGRRQVASSVRELRIYPRAVGFLLLATIFGPVIGVTLSQVAVQRAPVGIASTLMSLTPIFLIPLGFVIFKEKVSWRTSLGTLVAFVGTALLFV